MVIILPDCYRETVRRWMVNLFTWAEGPAFLGANVWSGNVCFECSAAGLELMPVLSDEWAVFALMKGERMVAAIKMERNEEADGEFISDMIAACSGQKYYRA